MSRKVWITFVIVSVLVISLISYNLAPKNNNEKKIIVGRVILTNSAESYNIDINNFEFVPDNLIVSLGSHVTWTNIDDAPHHVTSDDEILFNSFLLENGESFSYTFNDVGEYSYHCHIHPDMKGKIIVE